MLSALQKVGIVIAIGVVFLFGMVSTVYLSLRSPEVTVPEVVGKDRFIAETELQAAGLNFRVRAARPSRQIKSDTVMFQLPRPGEVVKVGQTVAVDIARVPKEGEASETIAAQDNSNSAANENSNKNDSPNSNSNENKPKRKNTNANANANANANGNRNSNSSKPNANVRANVNSGDENPTGKRTPQTDNENSNRANRNVNQAPTPRATPRAVATPPGRR
jgi:beta-lactam-binding protein with PASTA domain